MTTIQPFREEVAIIESINAMSVEQWFTSVDVAGKPSPRMSHTLWTMANAGQTNGEYILISAAGGGSRYMWTNTEKWNASTK